MPADGAARAGSQLLAAAALGLMAVQAWLGPQAAWQWRAGVAGAAVLLAVLGARAVASARSIAALVAMLCVANATGVLWQVVLLVVLVAFSLLQRWLPELAPSAAWRARGTLPFGATALVGLVTPLALVGWLRLLRPDLHDLLDAYVPALPLPLLLLGAVAFVAVNALGEELVWRGLLQDRLCSLMGVRAAVLLQALSFGLQHAHGFPRGPVGIALVAIWGVMLGWLRERAHGLLAPLLAHVVADTTIAIVVLFVLRA